MSFKENFHQKQMEGQEANDVFEIRRIGTMDLQIFFQWHKLLHLLLPIMIIFALQKKIGLLKVCFALFIVGFLKEIYDTIVQIDPLWVSVGDMVLNLVGIILGIFIVKIKNSLFH